VTLNPPSRTSRTPWEQFQIKTGNDDAIRVFLGLLADDAGYRIDWPAVPPAALTPPPPPTPGTPTRCA
jgi:hypothetical protein